MFKRLRSKGLIFLPMLLLVAALAIFGNAKATYAATGQLPVVNVVLSKDITTINVGSSDTLMDVILPVNATNQGVVWISSNPAVATVDSTGKVTAVAPGRASVSVITQDGNRRATCSVVVPAPVTGVGFGRVTAETLNIGDNTTLNPVITPYSATNKNVTWSSDAPGIATVDQNGRVVALSGGTANIKVTTVDGSFTATLPITVQTGISQVTLTPTSATLVVGSTTTLTATINPPTATNPAVTWRSTNPAVATVDSTGKVTGITPGTSYIYVKTQEGNLTANARVTVTMPVTGVGFSQTTATMDVGGSLYLRPVVTPVNATNKEVTWSSSNAGIATVDQYGRVVGVSNGSATLTATTVDGGFTATVAITVQTGITQVVMNKSTDLLNVGTSDTLAVTINPTNAANPNVTWRSSNPTVVTVDSNGNITALKPGRAIIYATTQDGNKTVYSVVTVPYVVTGISFRTSSATLDVGYSIVLYPLITPYNATNRSVTWTSSAPAIATVDQTGRITGVGTGSAVITATTADGGFTATFNVTVQTGVTSIILNERIASIPVGSSQTLVPIILPNNATNQNVTWSSSNPAVATVDATGKVTAIKYGTAVITVRTQDGNKIATCFVYAQ